MKSSGKNVEKMALILKLPGKSRCGTRLGLSDFVCSEQILINAPMSMTRASAMSRTAHLAKISRKL